MFTMKEDNLELKSSDIVYKCTHYDYGMTSDHQRITGEPHINVTLD